jgi:cobalt-zinc-cadmium efflux system outer membrane protein
MKPSHLRGTPMVRRSFRVLQGLALLVLAGSARAEPLAELDVIRLVAARSPDVAIARAETAAVAAREAEAELYPNPSLSWEREDIPSAAGSREDTFALALPIDVSGRRGARAALARSDTHAAAAHEARSRSAAAVRALATFYAALSADLRVAIERQSAVRLREFVRVLNRRQEEGTASGYERTRLEIELELAESDLRRAESEADALRTDLMLLLALEAPPSELRGALTVSTPPSQGERSTRQLPSVAMTQASAREARAAVENASSAWVPSVTVQGGLRTTNGDASRYGYLAGVVLDIPVFSRGQDLRSLARAQEQLARARRQASERASRAEAVRAAQRLSRAQRALARFSEATGDRLERLGRASEAGYREGTRSITELLDAERARAEVERERLELLSAVKAAELALRAARGEFE